MLSGSLNQSDCKCHRLLILWITFLSPDSVTLQISKLIATAILLNAISIIIKHSIYHLVDWLYEWYVNAGEAGLGTKIYTVLKGGSIP